MEVAPDSNAGLKLYKRRWVVEVFFMVFAALSAYQWSQYVVVEDVIVDYYNVTPVSVEWTAMSYAFCYTVFIIPWTYLLEKIGLRKILLLAATFNAVGAVIKVFSGARDSFMVVLVGQWLVALGQLGFLPARVAAVWFGPDEVSRACAMGVIGNQAGLAMGFFAPPLLIKRNVDKDVTRSEINLANYLVAGGSVAILILMCFGFENQPTLPPSRAAEEQRKEAVDFIGTLKRLFTNKGYVLLILVYGLTLGAFQAIATLMNRVVLAFFPEASEDVGWIGLIAILGGGVGSFVAGYILDKFGRFKDVAVTVCSCAALSMLALGLTVNRGHIVFVYLSSTALGFFASGFLTVGFEFGAELAYPENEGVSTGIVNGLSQIFTILATLIGSWVIDEAGGIWCCYCLFFILVLTVLLASAIPKNYNRRAMQTER